MYKGLEAGDKNNLGWTSSVSGGSASGKSAKGQKTSVGAQLELCKL